jgi:reactive intermediate/imine deaminase
MKKIINTKNAPAAIGPYSQAVQCQQTVYLSGQIPLNPNTMEIVGTDIHLQTQQVLENLRAVAKAAGGDLKDMVKLTIYLTDLTHFTVVNELMKTYFSEPYPARVTIGVAALPKNALVEIEGVMFIEK